MSHMNASCQVQLSRVSHDWIACIENRTILMEYRALLIECRGLFSWKVGFLDRI